MNENILNTTKKFLGIAPCDDNFDIDILLCINMAVSYLAQMGVTAINSVEITETTTYSALSSKMIIIQMIKPYICIKTRLLFDPPNSSVQNSMEAQLTELEWRMYTWADHTNSESEDTP